MTEYKLAGDGFEYEIIFGDLPKMSNDNSKKGYVLSNVVFCLKHEPEDWDFEIYSSNPDFGEEHTCTVCHCRLIRQ